MSIEELDIQQPHVVELDGRPAIAVPAIDGDGDGTWVYLHFEGALKDEITDADIESALKLAEVFSHLYWDEVAEYFDSCKSEVEPTDPIEL